MVIVSISERSQNFLWDADQPESAKNTIKFWVFQFWMMKNL